MAWELPTMASLEDLPGGTPCKAPCCGRSSCADMLVKNPDTSEGAPEYLCGACREALFLNGVMTREAFLAALGADESALSRVRATDKTFERVANAVRSRRG